VHGHTDRASSANPPRHAVADKELPAPMSESASVLSMSQAAVIAIYVMLTFALVGVLYAARSLLMPVIAALVIGTMLSAGTEHLQRYRIPRLLSGIALIVAACGVVAMVIGLLSMQALEWSSHFGDIASALKDKLHFFDRPLALWRELQAAIGANPSDGNFQMPQIEWVQPTLQFLSPTITEMLIFFVTLILFVASWPDLRRALILTFAERDARLRTLRILNAIEHQLGRYLLTVTCINLGVGIATGLIAAMTGLPNPAALGALAATLNYIPVIGPVATLAALLVTGVITKATLGAGLMAPLLFAICAFLEGHFVTPTIIGRRLELNALAVFLAFAFWTWLWGPIGAFLASPMLIVALILKEHLYPPQPLPRLSGS
jgi:predicted PurR-regulated permease PerM